jgi:hypothetical protein
MVARVAANTTTCDRCRSGTNRDEVFPAMPFDPHDLIQITKELLQIAPLGFRVYDEIQKRRGGASPCNRADCNARQPSGKGSRRRLLR